MNNHDVVPYNAYLAKRFNTHINVEVTTSIRLVKYMFKYSFKGHDRAHVEVGAAPDEIQAHLDARHLVATEAAWRLSEFDMNGSSHIVTGLAVHLPQENLVLFRPGGALQRATTQATTLTTWFTFNAGLEPGSSFQDVLYHDMPLYCMECCHADVAAAKMWTSPVPAYCGSHGCCWAN